MEEARQNFERYPRPLNVIEGPLMKVHVWAILRKKGLSGIYRWQILGLAYTSMQSDQGLCWLPTKSLDTTEFTIHANADLGFYCLLLTSFKTVLRQRCITKHCSKLQKKHFFQPKSIDIFLISAQKICCGYSLEVPHWGASNEYPQYTFFCAGINKYYLDTPLLSGAMTRSVVSTYRSICVTSS